MSTADDIITEVTRAPTEVAAKDVMDQVRSRQLLLEVADLLYIDADGHASAWLRKEIVKKAKS